MAKKSTAPVNTANAEDEDLPQTGVKPRAKDMLIQNMQSKLAEFMDPSEDEVPPVEPTNKEEETFKKRYGDLRRYMQEKDNKYGKQVNDLTAQIEQLTKLTNQPMPKTKEEFEAWKAKYPDIASFIEIIADEKAGQRASQLQEELSGVKLKLSETEKEKAYATLKVLVPELEEIVNSNEYGEWFNSQPPFVQDELNTSDDPHRIAYYMNIYKTSINKPVTRTSKASKLDALDTSVRNTGVSPSNARNTWKYTQSQIQKMSTAEYTKNEEDIIAARNAGLILDDVSKRNSVFDVV